MEKTTGHEVMEHLHALMSSFKRSMHQAVRDSEAGLAPMEARALAYFARHAGHTQSDLVAHAGRDKAQIARIVKGLQQRGLLGSAPDPSDGRSQQLRLTDEGRTMQRTMQQHRSRFEAALLAGFSEAERAALLAQLGRLRANVTPEADPAA